VSAAVTFTIILLSAAKPLCRRSHLIRVSACALQENAGALKEHARTDSEPDIWGVGICWRKGPEQVPLYAFIVCPSQALRLEAETLGISHNITARSPYTKRNWSWGGYNLCSHILTDCLAQARWNYGPQTYCETLRTILYLIYIEFFLRLQKACQQLVATPFVAITWLAMAFITHITHFSPS
jgi:hypothetical protein